MISKTFVVIAVLLCSFAKLAHASLGQAEIPATSTDGPVTMFYPSSDAARPIKRGRLVLNLAADGSFAKQHRQNVLQRRRVVELSNLPACESRLSSIGPLSICAVSAHD